MPEVLNRRDFPGRLPPRTKLVDRTTPFGNPFQIGRDGDRETVIAKCRAWIDTQPELKARAIAELRGYNLMCHCEPEPCHARIWLCIVNEP